MPCDNFTINNNGKAIVENVEDVGDLKLSNKNLSILKLSDGNYLLNKESIAKLRDYTKQDLEENPIYLVVGQTMERDKGIASRISDLEKLNGINKNKASKKILNKEIIRIFFFFKNIILDFIL